MERDSIEEGLLPSPRSKNSNKATSTNSSSMITPVLLLSTFVAISGSFCFGCAVGYTSPAESGIIQDLGLSVAEYSVFGSIMTFGGMIGAIVSGKIADFVGRKRTMWLSEIFCCVGWLAIAFAKNAWWLDIGRLLMGLGVGVISYVVPVYIAEIAPKDIRGRLTSANQLMVTFGFALLYFVGNLIAWRTLSLIGLIPSVVQIIGLFFIPESPRWLEKIGREKESESALQQLRGANADISQEAIEIRHAIENLEHEQKGRTFELFQKRYAYSTIVGVGLMALQQFAGNSGMAYYASTIFAESRKSLYNFSTTVGTNALAVIMILAAIVGLLVMDVYGRRPLLMVSSGGMCLGLLLVGLCFHLKDLQYLKELTPILTCVVLLSAVGFFTVGTAGIPWVIMSEIFPINVKATAGSLVTLTNWSSAWVVTYTFNFMMEWSSAGTFFILAGVSGLTVIFVWRLVPETKGRTLEEIEANITHFPQRW